MTVWVSGGGGITGAVVVVRGARVVVTGAGVVVTYGGGEIGRSGASSSSSAGGSGIVTGRARLDSNIERQSPLGGGVVVAGAKTGSGVGVVVVVVVVVPTLTGNSAPQTMQMSAPGSFGAPQLLQIGRVESLVMLSPSVIACVPFAAKCASEPD